MKKVLIFLCCALLAVTAAALLSAKFTGPENAVKQSAINKAEEEYPGYKFECAGVAQNFETKTYSVAVRPTNFDIPTLVCITKLNLQQTAIIMPCTQAAEIQVCSG